MLQNLTYFQKLVYVAIKIFLHIMQGVCFPLIYHVISSSDYAIVFIFTQHTNELLP